MSGERKKNKGMMTVKPTPFYLLMLGIPWYRVVQIIDLEYIFPLGLSFGI